MPEYLKLRFDEKTRAFNACHFRRDDHFLVGHLDVCPGAAAATGAGLEFHVSVLASAAIVLAYTFLGGLTSAIYNEVLQFLLIVMGFAPLAIISVNKAGGWRGIVGAPAAG